MLCFLPLLWYVNGSVDIPQQMMQPWQPDQNPTSKVTPALTGVKVSAGDVKDTVY